jgi:hypothetical protein
MAATNPSTDISTYIQTIYEDAMFILRENTLMPNLITVFDDKTGSADRSSSEYTSATMATIGELDDLQSQAFTPSVLATLTPAEAGGQFFLPDLRIESDPFALQSDASRELGMSMSEKMHTDTLGNFSSLTAGTVGAAGTTITWGHFFAARAQLKNAKAPMPYRCVLHEYQWYQLAKASSIAASTSPAAAPQFTEEVTRQYYVATVAGVDIFTTADITVDASDDANGGMFSPMAMAMDMRRAPRLEPERDASRRGWELNMTSVYAHGVWRPATGICLTFDAATPTS